MVTFVVESMATQGSQTSLLSKEATEGNTCSGWRAILVPAFTSVVAGTKMGMIRMAATSIPAMIRTIFNAFIGIELDKNRTL